jgi:hypothetical protein
MVVAPDGSVARVLGRRGQGPGELSGIHRAVALPDGRIGLANGVAAPTFLIGGRGVLVLLDQASEPAGVWHLAGQPGDIPVCMVRDLRSARSELLVASMRTLIAADLTMTGVQELSLVAVPAGERTTLARRVWQSPRVAMVVPEQVAHEPAVGRVRWRPDGRLWVEPGATAPADGVVASFDELTADGTLLRRVHLVAPGADPGDRLIVMEDGRFVLLRGFAPDTDEGQLDLMPEAALLAI